MTSSYFMNSDLADSMALRAAVGIASLSLVPVPDRRCITEVPAMHRLFLFLS